MTVVLVAANGGAGDSGRVGYNGGDRGVGHDGGAGYNGHCR